MSKKYNLHIDACGCCNSPWVVDTATGDIVGSIDFTKDGYEVYR